MSMPSRRLSTMDSSTMASESRPASARLASGDTSSASSCRSSIMIVFSISYMSPPLSGSWMSLCVMNIELGPGQRDSTPGQAAAEGDEQRAVAWLESSAQCCLGEQYGYRGSGSVADVGDVACHGILAQAERRGYRGVDPRIRLMSDQAVNVAHLPADRGQRLRSRRAHPFDRLP